MALKWHQSRAKHSHWLLQSTVSKIKHALYFYFLFFTFGEVKPASKSCRVIIQQKMICWIWKCGIKSDNWCLPSAAKTLSKNPILRPMPTFLRNLFPEEVTAQDTSENHFATHHLMHAVRIRMTIRVPLWCSDILGFSVFAHVCWTSLNLQIVA